MCVSKHAKNYKKNRHGYARHPACTSSTCTNGVKFAVHLTSDGLSHTYQLISAFFSN